VDYARRQAELFGVQARWVSQRFGPWGGLVRGTYTPRGGGYGVISEALTGWWLTAGDEPRLADLRPAITERATCTAALAVRAQSDREDAAEAARPGRVEGAWFIDGETRMDDQQHALAGLLRTIPIVEARASGSDDDAPSGWLWAAVLLLALNPPRAAFAVPREGRSRRTIVRLAVAGGAIGGLIVIVAVLAADPLLDLLDVSAPSFRLAAGIVAAVAGAADLFRRPPAPEPALPGWRAALVPIAIPAVLRPALLVLALGAGADERVLPSVRAMLLGIALLAVIAAAWPTEGASGRALTWASRLFAAGLMACGVILAIDGILAV
jgi:small neutral amino acid transporter SnatA (MarC family)